MDSMIATAKPRVARALARKSAEVDLALTVADAPQPDAPIVSKKPRLRGRARAAVAQTIEGPTSKRPVKLAPGVVLTRLYKGKRIVVKVLDEHVFEHDGKRFKSLSAIANLVSGTHCNGLVWFGIRKNKKETAR